MTEQETKAFFQYENKQSLMRMLARMMIERIKLNPEDFSPVAREWAQELETLFKAEVGNA